MPLESRSDMKAPLELDHLMEAGVEEVEALLLEVDTLGGCTMDRLAGDSASGMEIVPVEL